MVRKLGSKNTLSTNSQYESAVKLIYKFALSNVWDLCKVSKLLRKIITIMLLLTGATGLNIFCKCAAWKVYVNTWNRLSFDWDGVFIIEKSISYFTLLGYFAAHLYVTINRRFRMKLQYKSTKIISNILVAYEYAIFSLMVIFCGIKNSALI